MITERMQQLAGVKLDEEVDSKSFERIYNAMLNSSFPIKVPYYPKELGKGTKGVVYDVGKNIVKITKDESEAKASSLIAGKNIEGIWKVDGVYQTKKVDGFWFIIGEKLKENDKKAMDLEIIMNTFPESSSKWDATVYSEVLKALDDPDEESPVAHPGRVINLIRSKPEDRKLAEDLATGMHNLNKLGIAFMDLHAGNIMFRGNKPVIVDLGYSHSKRGKIGVFERGL